MVLFDISTFIDYTDVSYCFDEDFFANALEFSVFETLLRLHFVDKNFVFPSK